MSARTWSWIASTLLAALPAVQAGCSQVVCGDGTIERDGVCLPADTQPGSATCGEGTELAGGTCVPTVTTVCDPDTTEEEVDQATGVTTCVGISTDICTRSLDCPAPTNGKLTLCGRIHDAETDQVVRAADATGALCNPAAPTADGPCSLKIQFFDALLFQMDPLGTTPLVPAMGFEVDDCGRYRARDLPMTSFGFIGASVDDGAGNPDLRVLTGAATADAISTPNRDFRLYTTRKTTEAAWSAAANLTGPNTFINQGVILMVFRHKAVPAPNVVVTLNNNPIPADDFYFSDPGVSRSTLDLTRTKTGPNGAALLINGASPSPYSGTGGEPAGCRWPSALSATIQNVVFVQLKDAESTGGGPCP